VRNPSYSRTRNTAAALLAVLALGTAATGCGGGGSDSESESASRKKLEAGATKINGAKSMRVSLLFEAEEDGESEELGCLDLAVDTAKPERVDLTFFDLNCSGGSEAHELIAIGHRAWADSSDDPESWTAAKITPELLHELGDEQTDFGKLMAAAEDIEVHPEDGAVEEGESNFVDVPSYSFEAPASAFPGSDDLGDLKVEFEATLDRHGYLRELMFHGDEDGTGATVTANYEDINQDQGITRPDPSEVKGPARSIHTRDELDALFGLPSS
jgi:hypothetical protein